MNHRACYALLLAITGAALGGCEDGRVGIELSADRPAAAATQQVVVTIEGLTLQRDDGGEDRINLDEPLRVDLMRYDGQGFALLDGEALDAGDYTGIRLRFRDSDNSDTDNYVIDANGGQRPLKINASETTFEPLNLKVKKSGKSYVIQLRLDLRLSLSASGNTRTLTPVLRAARDTKAATVSGTVKTSLVTASSCRDGRSNGVGVAVYAFRGRDIEPDDRNGAEPDPIASSPVLQNGSGNWNYTLGVLAPGDYTLALTCDGDREDALSDDDLDFDNSTHNLSLDEGDDQDQDFD